MALAWDLVWLALTRAMGHSSFGLMAPGTIITLVLAGVFGAAFTLLGEFPAYVVLLACLLLHLGRLMHDYNTFYSTPATTV